MKICINALFLQNHLGGIGWYCYSLIKNLKEKYPTLDITLLTHKGVAPQFYPIKNLIRIKEIGFKRRWLRLVYFHVFFPLRMKRHYDLLHSVGNIGMLWCPITQVITICDTYEKVCPERFGKVKRTLMSFMISMSGRNATGIIAISKNTFLDIARFYPQLKDKTRVIYLGNRFAPQIQANYTPQKQFLFVGTIEPGKNLITILKAFALFKRTHEAKLKVIGVKGWKQSSLRALIRSLDISENVEFIGYVTDDQLKKEYQASNALICASLYEGFGLPVIEALACGCPVISAKNSALFESGDSCVVFFETMDEKDLAQKMIHVLENPESVRENINKGFIHAAQFSWEKTAQETHDYYMLSITSNNTR